VEATLAYRLLESHLRNASVMFHQSNKPQGVLVKKCKITLTIRNKNGKGVYARQTGHTNVKESNTTRSAISLTTELVQFGRVRTFTGCHEGANLTGGKRRSHLQRGLLSCKSASVLLYRQERDRTINGKGEDLGQA